MVASELLFQGRANGVFELTHVVGYKVGQVAILGETPTGLDGVQLGRVSRQPLEINVLHPRSCDSSGGRAMYTPTIPTNNQRTSQLFPQLLDEINNLVGTNIVFVNLKGRAKSASRWRQRDGTEYTQAVVSIPSSLHRRLTRGCPGATIYRLQTKTCFVEKNDAGTPPFRFFLMRGQSCLRHRSTDSGSCSRAICRGFCGLNPRSWRMRDMWPGWYRTRNRLRTTWATRAHVHKSVRYPAAIGPANRIATNSCFCSSDSLAVPPGCGLAAKASTPPVFHARFQRFTLDKLTPKRRAMVRRGFRSWKNSAARRRRASSSAALPGVLIQHNTVLAAARVH